MYKDNKKIIVTMTSWIKRIDNVKTVLSSLLDQTIKPDSIELNLTLIDFPDRENSLPTDLRQFLEENNRLIHINWEEQDNGVFRKLIPTLKKYINQKEQEYYLLSVDDDFIYKPTYIERMINSLINYKTDYFCLENGNVVGSVMIYKSTCFSSDFWTRIPHELINIGISDIYIYHYLKFHKKRGYFDKPKDIDDLRQSFNPVHPNSRNEKTGGYSSKNLTRVSTLMRSIFRISKAANGRKPKKPIIPPPPKKRSNLHRFYF